MCLHLATPGEQNRNNLHCTRENLKCAMCIALCITIAAIVPILSFLVVEVYPTMNIDGQVFLLNHDTVVVQQNGINPFWYMEVTFRKNRSGDNGLVQLYVHPCHELLAKQSRAIHTNTTHINQSINEGSTFRVGSYYLVKDSNFFFDVNITAHFELPSCSASLYIFQDYESYSNFLADGSDTGKARQICLLISNVTSVTDHHASYSFIANETSYYFIGLSVPRGSEGVDDIYYQTTGTQLYYTTGNLPLACSIVPGTNSSCSACLAAGEPITSTRNTKCFLAVADSCPENGLYIKYFSSSTHPHSPIQNIARIITGAFSILIVLYVTISLFIVTCAIAQCIRLKYKSSRNREECVPLVVT